MRRYFFLVLKILGCLVALLVVLLVAAFLYVNSSSGQQRLLGFATDLLQEKLETKVQIDSVSINFRTFSINLMGLDVEDRQQRKMLQTDLLAVSLDLKDLLAHKIEVSKAEIDGLSAHLYHPQDSAANYQFLIDAFKRDKTEKKDSSKHQLTFDISKLRLSNISIEHHGFTKKGFQQTNTLSFSQLSVKLKGEKQLISVDSLHFVTDNHQPRKNTGRPHRGSFDAGHLDITANLELTVNHMGKDTAHVSLTKCVATDPVTGFDIKDLRLDAGISKNTAYLRNITLQHLNTVLSFDSAIVQLPSKKAGTKLAYQTSLITGRTLLKDISKPFAPALSRFSVPLELKVILSGTDSTMQFKNVHVNTTDQKLKIDAEGHINHLQEKEGLKIRFNVKKMTTHAQTAKKIIDQFVVKKFMMKQLNNLGSISYAGSFDILYKKEQFRGVLGTSAGRMNFSLTLNEKTKYLSGQVSTSAFQLGRVIEMKDIGDVACSASFNFDYSKPRTARIRRLKGGKLPMGQVHVSDVSASYKKIKFTNVDASIISDGAVAQGHISQQKKYADLLCDFSFTNTDAIHKMKIKPGLRLKNMPWQKKDKQDKEKDKEDKKEKKEKKDKKEKKEKKKDKKLK